jgi:hypothetical protein
MDLPARTIRTIHPDLVLERVTAECALLDVGIKALTRKAASGVHHFSGRKDLDAEVIDRAENFAILKEDPLERWLGKSQVHVAGTNLR